MIRVIGFGFAGFLVLLCAHGVLLFALAASFGIMSSRISPLSWFLFIVVIPPLLTIAGALPAIALGASKTRSLVIGFVACIAAMIIFNLPFQESRGFFDPSDALASIFMVGLPVLLASWRPLDALKISVATVLVPWLIFSALGVIVAIFSQNAAFLVVLLAWIVLPGVATLFQTRVSSQQSPPSG